MDTERFLFLPLNSGPTRKQWHVNNDIFYIPKCRWCGINNAVWSGKRKGGRYVMCSEKCRRLAIQDSFIKKFGGNPMSSSMVRNKKASTESVRYKGINLASAAQKSRNPEYISSLRTLIGAKYELVFYDEATTPRYSKIHEIKHKKCGNVFKIKAGNIRLRLKRKHELCLICGIHAGFSFEEKRMASHIRKFSGLEVIENYRIGKYYTIDAYIPDLRMGFCFDGDLYHAHPALFNADDKITKIHKIAKDVWAKDRRMNKAAEENGILLIRIWERNWLDGTGQSMIEKAIINISHLIMV